MSGLVEGRLLSEPKRCHHWQFASLSISDDSGGNAWGRGNLGGVRLQGEDSGEVIDVWGA